MRALILSCNTGGGHNSCSYALKDIFEEQGYFCEVTDSLAFISGIFSAQMETGHEMMYRHFPWFFRWGYGLCERHPRFFEEKGCIYRLMKVGAKRLYQYIEENNYDVVICTHVFSAVMVTTVKRKYPLKARTYFVATDYTSSPGARQSLLDYYFIPHETLKEEFYSPNVNDEKIICSGIPVRQPFYDKKPSEDTERKTSHMVIMSGSMGCGPIVPLIKHLAEHLEPTHLVTVVCGSNKKLKKQLDELVGDNKQFQILGYVDNMAALLDSADVYMTKPGGLSTTEAVNKEIPMVLVNAVAGCEEYNGNFFVEQGCAMKPESVELLAQESIELLNDEKRREEMIENCRKVGDKNSSRLIVDYIKNVADEDKIRNS